jgi:hypothetical protein
VDEVEEWIKQTLIDANIQSEEIVYKTAKLSLKAGINKHSKTHTLSDDEVLGFAEWLDKNNYSMFLDKWVQNVDDEPKTPTELLQLFKEQQIKTLIYE